MGSSTIFDIIASFVIAGFVMVMIVKLDRTITSSTYTVTNDLSVQTTMTSVVRILENDFRKIGYCADPTKVPDPSKSILAATAHSITFISDNDNNGKLDTLQYYVGDTTTCRKTSNPRDFLLYRKVNTANPQLFNIGLTRFDLVYYNSFADSLAFPIATSTLPSIYSMRLSVLLESPYAYDTTYSFSYWRQLRLAARNLVNR
jgi:hypothetical protein